MEDAVLNVNAFRIQYLNIQAKYYTRNSTRQEVSLFFTALHRQTGVIINEVTSWRTWRVHTYMTSLYTGYTTPYTVSKYVIIVRIL